MIIHSLWLHWNKLKQFYVHVEKMIQNQICSLIFLRCIPVQTRFPAGILPCLDEMIILLLVLLAFVQFEWAPGKDWKQAFVMGEGNRNVGEIRLIRNESVSIRQKIIAYLRHGEALVGTFARAHFPFCMSTSIHSGLFSRLIVCKLFE